MAHEIRANWSSKAGGKAGGKARGKAKGKAKGKLRRVKGGENKSRAFVVAFPWSADIEVARVSSSSEVEALAFKLLDGLSGGQKPPPLTIISRGEARTEENFLAHMFCQPWLASKGLGFSAVRGTLRPGEELDLDESLWERLFSLSTTGPAHLRRAKFLGVEPGTGRGVVALTLEQALKDTPLKGATTLVAWTGRLTFDPRGPRLVSADAKAEVEVIPPPGVAGEGTGRGKLSYRCRIRSAKDDRPLGGYPTPRHLMKAFVAAAKERDPKALSRCVSPKVNLGGRALLEGTMPPEKFSVLCSFLEQLKVTSVDVLDGGIAHVKATCEGRPMLVILVRGPEGWQLQSLR